MGLVVYRAENKALGLAGQTGILIDHQYNLIQYHYDQILGGHRRKLHKKLASDQLLFQL